MLNMCNFCTCYVPLQFGRLINVVDMSDNNRSVNSEQLCNLRLRQPHAVVLHANIQTGLTVGCLVYDNFSSVHTNKYRKIRLHLQKSSHLDFSPKIAIFVLSCKEIRRRRRQNGQAGARPCKITVGDAGIGQKKCFKPLIYIRLTNVQEHLYPHKGAFFQGSFFVARPAKKEENILYIIILQRNLTDSSNRKRKNRPKTLGLPELFGQPLSSFISCVTSSRRMIFLPDKASYTSVTCRRLCSSPAPVAGYSEKPCRSNPRASG